MKRISVVLVVVVAVLMGLVPAQPAQADNIFAEIGKVLFGSSGRAVAIERVDAKSAIFMQPRGRDWGVSYFTYEGEAGVNVETVYNFRVPLQRTVAPFLTGLVQVSQGSGEIREMTARIDSGQQFTVVDPPKAVENQEVWYRDVAYELRSKYRADSGHRLSEDVFPPFVSVGGKRDRPDGPYYFALPTTNLAMGVHRVSFRFVSKDRNGEFVSESHVDFMIIADDIVERLSVGVAGQYSAPTAPTTRPNPVPSTSPPPPPPPSPLADAPLEIRLRTTVCYGGPTNFKGIFTDAKVKDGRIPIVVYRGEEQVSIEDQVMEIYHGPWCLIWTPPGLSSRIFVGGKEVWRGTNPPLGGGVWIGP